jgi:hypothetical protein
MSNFADGLFPRYLEFVMLLPFIMLGFGLWFIGRAFSDRTDARPPDEQLQGRVTMLPDRTGRPLYHVHQQIRASARPKPKPKSETEPERGSGSLPRGRRRNGTRLELRR